LFHKDRFGTSGQTRLKHQEKRRKKPGFFVRGGRTFGKYPDFWKAGDFWKVQFPVFIAASITY
jgi:hypothetical protein